MTDAEAWKEQTAFERMQWELKRLRILRVAADDPDMPLCLLAERFGESDRRIGRVLIAAGLSRRPDFFSASLNGKRKMAG